MLLVALAFTIGGTLGALAGYLGGWVDELVMRAADLVFAIPTILLAMAVVAALGAGLFHAVLAVVLVSWPGHARVVRITGAHHDPVGLRQRRPAARLAHPPGARGRRPAQRRGPGGRAGRARDRQRNPAAERPLVPRTRRPPSHRGVGVDGVHRCPALRGVVDQASSRGSPSCPWCWPSTSSGTACATRFDPRRSPGPAALEAAAERPGSSDLARRRVRPALHRRRGQLRRRARQGVRTGRRERQRKDDDRARPARAAA